MATYGFSYVPEQGYISFAKELTEGHWKDISTDGVTTPSTALLPAAFISSPRQIYWKIRLQRSIENLQDALQRTSEQTPASVDPRWDSAQTQLRSLIVSAIEDEDPQRQAAGERLFRALLVGESGVGQNRFNYQKEADHGEMQVNLASKPPLQADAQLVGIERCIARIAKVTQELKDSLGRAPGQTSQLAVDRADLVRSALNATNETFNAVLGDIDWHIENMSGAQESLGSLRISLQALLDRYPAPKTPSKPPTESQ